MVQEIDLIRPLGIDPAFQMAFDRDTDKRDITEAEVTGLYNYVYSGRARRPEPIVTDHGNVLKKGTHYKVRYYHCIHAGSRLSCDVPTGQEESGQIYRGGENAGRLPGSCIGRIRHQTGRGQNQVSICFAEPTDSSVESPQKADRRISDTLHGKNGIPKKTLLIN